MNSATIDTSEKLCAFLELDAEVAIALQVFPKKEWGMLPFLWKRVVGVKETDRRS